LITFCVKQFLMRVFSVFSIAHSRHYTPPNFFFHYLPLNNPLACC
jgi:hypothetical protein